MQVQATHPQRLHIKYNTELFSFIETLQPLVAFLHYSNIPTYNVNNASQFLILVLRNNISSSDNIHLLHTR